MKNKRILILSANTGEGHNSAARAIREALESRGVQCSVQDGLACLPPFVNKIICRGHVFLYRRFPRLCGLGYRAGEILSRRQAFQKKLRSNAKTARKLSRSRQKLLDTVQNAHCDAIVCTHVFAACMISRLRIMGRIAVPCYFLATDYTCSPCVNQLDMDRWLIPHQNLLPEFASYGIPEEKIIPTGIPVPEEFLEKHSRMVLRQKLNLPAGKKIVALSCGSMGAGSMEKIVKTLIQTLPENALLIALCGSNRRLERRLGKLQRANLLVKGFVEKLSDYMEAADVYLSKPGGLSVTESMAKCVPLALFNAVPGLETRNMEFLTAIGCAASAPNLASLSQTIIELLNQSERRERLTSNCRRNASPNAAGQICSLIL